MSSEGVEHTARNVGMENIGMDNEGKVTINNPIYGEQIKEEGMMAINNAEQNRFDPLIKYIKEKTLNILGNDIPKGIPKDHYKNFLRKEIDSRAKDLAVEFMTQRIPTIKTVIKYIQEKKKEFLGDYHDFLISQKIDELENKISTLEKRLEPVSTGSNLPLTMEGGGYKKKRKTEKRNKKSRRQNKKTQKRNKTKKYRKKARKRN